MFKLITTGYFYADGGAMFGAVPKVTWSRAYPANGRNLCVLAMHAGVVAAGDGHLIVVDPGVGHDRLSDTPAVYYRFHNMTDICEALRQDGIAPEDVTDVVFTHLHFDHCGAAVRRNAAGAPVPAFPNAVHWASRAQYECEQHPHPLERESFLPANTAFLERAGLLRLVEATASPFASLRMQLYDGHTRGQIAAFIRYGAEEGETVVFPGDILPLASHVVPERISAYDLYPVSSYDGKTELLDEAARKGCPLVYYHDAGVPCATVRKVGASYKTGRTVERS